MAGPGLGKRKAPLRVPKGSPSAEDSAPSARRWRSAVGVWLREQAEWGFSPHPLL